MTRRSGGSLAAVRVSFARAGDGPPCGAWRGFVVVLKLTRVFLSTLSVTARVSQCALSQRDPTHSSPSMSPCPGSRSPAPPRLGLRRPSRVPDRLLRTKIQPQSRHTPHGGSEKRFHVSVKTSMTSPSTMSSSTGVCLSLMRLPSNKKRIELISETPWWLQKASMRYFSDVVFLI